MDSPSGTHQEPGHPFVFTQRRGNRSNRDVVRRRIIQFWQRRGQQDGEETQSGYRNGLDCGGAIGSGRSASAEIKIEREGKMTTTYQGETKMKSFVMEKTLGTHQEPGHTSSSFDGGDNPSNRNITLAPDHSGPAAAAVAAKVMKHNPGIAMDWTTEEQWVLEEGLRAFASDTNVIRYAKIAMQLENKTVRDVALRCRWMSRKENSKRKKEGHNLSRKTKDRKEKGTEPSAKSSQLALQADAPPHVMPMIPVDFDDGKSSKANGVSAMKLLENNARAFNQIAANFSSLQIEDNISLFCQARDNLQVLLNSLKDEPEAMKKMPPLPDKLNEEMINSILHPPARPAPRQP